MKKLILLVSIFWAMEVFGTTYVPGSEGIAFYRPYTTQGHGKNDELVDVTVGNVLLQSTDLSLPVGNGKYLTLTRTLNVASGSPAYNPIPAGNWIFNVPYYVENSSYTYVTIYLGDGGEIIDAVPESTDSIHYNQAIRGIWLYGIYFPDGTFWSFNDDYSSERLISEVKYKGYYGYTLIKYHYSSGRVDSITTASGLTVRLHYGSNEQLSAIIQPDGDSTIFTYDADTNLIAVTDPAGRTTTYDYYTDLPKPRIKTITYPESLKVDYEYYEPDHPLKIQKKIRTDIWTGRADTVVYTYYNAITNSDGDTLQIDVDEIKNSIRSVNYHFSRSDTSEPLLIDWEYTHLSGETGSSPDSIVYSWNVGAYGVLLYEKWEYKYGTMYNHTTYYAYNFSTSNYTDATDVPVWVERCSSDRKLDKYINFYHIPLKNNSLYFEAPDRIYNSYGKYIDGQWQYTDTIITDYNYNTSYESGAVIDVSLASTAENGDTMSKYSYQDYGNIKNINKTYNALGDSQQYFYDDLSVNGENFYSYNHTLPTKIVDEEENTYFVGYDTLTGKKIKEIYKDFDNIKRYKYDKVGRLLEIKIDGDTLPLVRYKYDDIHNKKYEIIYRREASGTGVGILAAPGTQPSTNDSTAVCYTYDGFGKLIKKEIIGGGVWTYEYDKFGQLIQQSDPLGNITKYEYDKLGRLIKIIYPDDAYTTYSYQYTDTEYNGAFITTVMDPKGKKTVTKKDFWGNIREIDKYNSKGQYTDTTTGETYDKIVYEYDAMGKLKQVENENGQIKTQKYGLHHRYITDTEDPDRGHIHYGYDLIGNLLKIQTPEDSLKKQYTKNIYDKKGRIIEQGIEYLGNAFTIDTIDDFESGTSSMWGSTNGVDSSSNIAYEGDSALYFEAYSADYDSGWVYRTFSSPLDLSGMDLLRIAVKSGTYLPQQQQPNLTTVSDYNSTSEIHIHIIDTDGKDVAFTTPVSTDWELKSFSLDPSFDINYSQIQTMKVTGIQANSSYALSFYIDFLNAKDNFLVDSSFTSKKKFYYDKYADYDIPPPPSALNYPTGKLTMVNTDVDSIFYYYDRRGRVAEKHTIIKELGKEYITKYQYDLADNLKMIIYPDNDTVYYSYDANNRLCDVSDPSIGWKYAGYQYYDDNSLKEISLGNNIITALSYTSRGFLNDIDAGKYYHISYDYDKAGNKINEYRDGSSYSTYKYTDLYELADEYYDTGQENTYEYDPVGNRTSFNGVNWTYYPGTNRLQSDGVDTYYYDKNGNLIKKGSKETFEYDYLNRMKKYNFYGDSIQIETKYSGTGLRREKILTEKYVHDERAILFTSEDYGDIIYPGDYPEARDIGDIAVKIWPKWVRFIINHKIVYNNQGELENLYIALDTKAGGNRWFPDSINKVVPESMSWDYCIYVYSKKDFGIIDRDGNRIKNPSGMTVYFDKVGKDAEMVVKIPIKYFTGADRFNFAIATVEPGQEEVTDVAGGGSDGEIQPFSIAAPPGTQVEYVKTYTYYLYDENGNILCELDKDGNITAKYLYGNGLIAKRTAKDVSHTYFYHQDPVGSVIMITDYQGNILKQYKYTAFGTIMEQTGSLNNDVKFVGKEQDRSGLYSFPARYYSPGLGRFITTDPYLPSHPYNYCENNPVNYIDPMGLVIQGPTVYIYGKEVSIEELIQNGLECNVQFLPAWDLIEGIGDAYNPLASLSKNTFEGWGAENQNAPGPGNPPPDVTSINLVALIEAYSPSSVDPLTYFTEKRFPPQEAPKPVVTAPPGVPQYVDWEAWLSIKHFGVSIGYAYSPYQGTFWHVSFTGGEGSIIGSSVTEGYSPLHRGIALIGQSGAGIGGQVGMYLNPYLKRNERFFRESGAYFGYEASGGIMIMWGGGK